MKKFLISLFSQFLGVGIALAGGSFSLNSAEGVTYSDNYIKSTLGQLTVYVVNSLDNSSSLSFTSSQDSLYNLNWYSYTESVDNLTKISDGYNQKGGVTTLLSPTSDKGYLVSYYDAEGNLSKYYVWLSQYQPITSVAWNKDEYYCDRLPIHLSPIMNYLPLVGQQMTIKRDEEISYGVFLYQSGTKVESKTEEITADSLCYIDVPTINTPFKFTNVDFGTVFTSDTFVTYAVNAFPQILADDKFENEIDDSTKVYFFDNSRSSTPSFRSSGPLNLQIKGNFSPAVNDYTWYFDTDNSFDNPVPYSHQNMENITDCSILNEKGEHWIKVVVKNNQSGCEYESFGHIVIDSSALYIPNAFTPDETDNKEFKVAYKSIESFECRIYNQWGRKLYDSDRIDEGWDGTHNGHEMPTGVYFYVIKAKGLDGATYNKKGTINLIRAF